MKTALSLSSPKEWEEALNYNAGFREIRIDLIDGKESADELLSLCRKKSDDIPIIATIRSIKEGGKFSKSQKEWRELIEPWLCCTDYVDIERDFRLFAPEIKASKKSVIGSVHLGYMPDKRELYDIESELREYCDIPKIVVTPKNLSDVADFIKFTAMSKKPVITSVMGEEFKFARVPLLLTGSMLIYCHCGKEASKGQYHIRDIKKIIEILR